ncbi:putative 1-phosphatidylinositol phosphodiesterase [Streptomyces viridochromogenes Tue57]|uniref:1-phosphatidylinositol phosphodiesterase n=1 Tax=Streptomyces viridochromogenes Tue57 TaxID=1160705 RepID=L8PQS9_STRVR|nr:putative 1-phosphatidylinositol phosphodiesterase [Streptomyces viridochromogenes Tue57]
MVLTALAALLIVLVPGATAAWADGRHSEGLGAVSHPDWMASLPDAAPLAALSIPGTHDTMARNVTFVAETQKSPLPEQLNAGVRALDIRARHFHDHFTIHHGAVYLNANFTDVLRQTTDFLKAHPGEAVLMRLNEEHTAAYNTRTFAQTLRWYLEQNPDTAGLARDHLWRPLHGAQSAPTLGEVRGKIVLLQEFDGEGTDFGLSYWSPAMNIQDAYDVPSLFHIKGKWETARGHLEDAATRDPGKLYITFLSGVGPGAYPHAVAAGALWFTGVNHYALHHFQGRDVWRTGVVMMDYPGPDLVEAVLRYNRHVQS